MPDTFKRAQEINGNPPAKVIEATILWNVTPEEYATAHGISRSAGYALFNHLIGCKFKFVTRCGPITKRYPLGKHLRMYRPYFAELLKPSGKNLYEVAEEVFIARPNS